MIETWLASGDQRMVAWGAHYASEMRDTAAVPELTSLANRWQKLVPADTNDNGKPILSDAQEQARDAMAGVLDALIQMNIALPHDTLRELAHDFPANTAIFLARLPASDSADLRMGFFRDPSHETSTLRYVAAALLAREPQPGFAAELMGGIRVMANVQVLSPGITPGGRGFAGDCVSNAEDARENWPLTPQYKLSLAEGADNDELVGGAVPIHMERVMQAGFEADSCVGGLYLSSQARQTLVAEMLSVKPDAIAWETAVYHTILYRSQKQYEAELLAFLNGEIEKQHATATALADKGVITPGDVAEAMPEILLEVDDQRGAQAELADVTNLPSRVSYSKYYKWPEE